MVLSTRPMHISDLRALLQGMAIDTTAIDASSLTISTQDERDQLMALLRPFHGVMPRPLAQVGTVHFQGRADHTIVIQKSNLLFLCSKLLRLHTLAFTHVACLRLPRACDEAEKYNNTINLERIVIDNIHTWADRRVCAFCPQDLVYFLSPFGTVGDVNVCLDEWAVSPDGTALQTLIDDSLSRACVVEQLTLRCGDWATAEAWFRALRGQKGLALTSVDPPAFNRLLGDGDRVSRGSSVAATKCS